MKKTILTIIFLLGLTYLLWPGPNHTNDFPPLPGSLKSVEPGDTWENPNNAAYYSDFRRAYVIDFYRNQMNHLNIFGIQIPAFRKNYPPEEAFTYIRDQQQSTYLEEFSYPLRESLFVNGFEPFDEQGKPYRNGAHHMLIDGTFYATKTTLRYYGSSIQNRIIIYLLIWISIYFIYKITRKAIAEK